MLNDNCLINNNENRKYLNKLIKNDDSKIYDLNNSMLFKSYAYAIDIINSQKYSPCVERLIRNTYMGINKCSSSKGPDLIIDDHIWECKTSFVLNGDDNARFLQLRLNENVDYLFTIIRYSDNSSCYHILTMALGKYDLLKYKNEFSSSHGKLSEAREYSWNLTISDIFSRYCNNIVFDYFYNGNCFESNIIKNNVIIDNTYNNEPFMFVIPENLIKKHFLQNKKYK